jgi:hypothetical protein
MAFLSQLMRAMLDEMYSSGKFTFRKGVRVGTAKVMRTRPIFGLGWSANATVVFNDAVFNRQQIEDLVAAAGSQIGYVRMASSIRAFFCQRRRIRLTLWPSRPMIKAPERELFHGQRHGWAGQGRVGSGVGVRSANQGQRFAVAVQAVANGRGWFGTGTRSAMYGQRLGVARKGMARRGLVRARGVQVEVGGLVWPGTAWQGWAGRGLVWARGVH